MPEHALEAMEITRGKSSKDIESDRVLSLALVRLLEITGEAATRVKDTTKRDTPQIPRAEIVGLRNRLIHGYDSADMSIVCEILTSDVPKLVS
jgi:uncharacterized protein with HEPN domain